MRSSSRESAQQQNQTLAYPLSNVRISIQNEPPPLAANSAVVAAMDNNVVFSEAQRLLCKLQEDERKNKRKAVQPTRRFSQDPQLPSLIKSQPNLTVTPPHVEDGGGGGVEAEPPALLLTHQSSPKMNPTPRTHSSEGESELMIYLSSPTTSSTDGGSSSSSSWRAPSRDCTEDIISTIPTL